MASVSDQTAIRTSVASSASDGVLFAANGSAGGRTVFNESSAILYIAFGTLTASATNYTTQVAAGAYYEFPTAGRFYGGEVRAIWASANGFARCTEW